VATINKMDLARAVAEETGLSNNQVKEALDAAFEQITNGLKGGNEISLSGFGKFAVSERSARQGRNPQTGETIQIAATKVPRFQAAAPLKQAVKS
jgi:DNA-binding protein HU-beta